MSSTSVPFNSPFFYGWLIVLISALATYFSGPGQTYSISVFIQSYIHDLRLSRADVSGIYAVATLISGLTLFVVGRLVDRHGARAMTVVAGIGLGLATLGSSFVTGPIGLFISFLFLRLFGQGSLTLIPSSLVPQWFVQFRGRALSFMAVGGLVSGATVPLINNWMIERWNWQTTWRIWALIIFVLFVPLAYYFIRNKPEDIGLSPDRKSRERPNQIHDAPNFVPLDEVSWTFPETVKSPVFWALLFCAFVPSMVGTGLTFNLFSILQEHHMNRNLAALMLTLVPVIGFASALFSGFLLEKVKVHYVLALIFLLKLLELVLLYFAQSSLMIIMFITSWGISQGILNIAMKIVFPDYFGRKHLGSINSLNMTVVVCGSAFGPILFGWAYDHFGGYQQIMLVMMAFPLAAMLISLVLRKPVKTEAFGS